MLLDVISCVSAIFGFQALAPYLDEIGAGIAIVGSIATVAKSVTERSRSRSSLISRRNHEIDEVGKLAAFYTQIAQADLAPEHVHVVQEQIHSRLQESVAAIQDLDLKLMEGDKDPVWHFGPWKKMFLWFSPKGWRAIALHILTYVCLASALALLPFSILHYKGILRNIFRNIFQNQDHATGFAIGTAVALIYGSIFHFWALDEYRRQEHYSKKPGIVSRLFLIQTPETMRMFFAQLLFFLWPTLIIASLVDIIRDWSNHSAYQHGISLTGLVVLSLYTSIFHGWAVAEHDYWQNRPQLTSSLDAMSHGLFRNVKQSGWPKIKLICAGFLTIIVGLGILGVATTSLVERDWLQSTLVAMAGVLFVLITLYPASRTVKIRYSLAEEKKRAASASGSR